MPGADFFRHLGLFVVRDFLDPAACQELCKSMAAAPGRKAYIARAYEKLLDESVRRVECITLDKTLTAPLQQRIAGLKPDLEKHFGVALEGCEPPDFLVYRQGDFFIAHYDGGSHSKQRELRQRRVSAVIFLNRESREPEDGETYGQGNLTFHGIMEGPEWDKCIFALNAEPGLFIAFPAGLVHEVTPVSFGRRFTVVTWFYGRDSDTTPEQPAAVEEVTY